MTHLLPAKDVELVRSLGKAAHVLILLLMLDKPVGESDIAGILNLYPTTVRNYLRSLEHLGMATRISRYEGWILTDDGRQVILGSSWINHNGSKDAAKKDIGQVEGKIKTSVKKPRSNGKIKTSGKKSRSSMKNSLSNGKKSRSRPPAAASLSLSLKEEDKEAAAAKMRASVKKSRSSVKISRSLSGRRHQSRKKRIQCRSFYFAIGFTSPRKHSSVCIHRPGAKRLHLRDMRNGPRLSRLHPGSEKTVAGGAQVFSRPSVDGDPEQGLPGG